MMSSQDRIKVPSYPFNTFYKWLELVSELFRCNFHGLFFYLALISVILSVVWKSILFLCSRIQTIPVFTYPNNRIFSVCLSVTVCLFLSFISGRWTLFYFFMLLWQDLGNINQSLFLNNKIHNPKITVKFPSWLTRSWLVFNKSQMMGYLDNFFILPLWNEWTMV